MRALQPLQSPGEPSRSIAAPVVRHHSLDPHVPVPEPLHSPLDKRRRGHAFLIRRHLGVRHSRRSANARAGTPKRLRGLGGAGPRDSGTRLRESGPASSSPGAAARPAYSSRSGPPRVVAPEPSPGPGPAAEITARPSRSPDPVPQLSAGPSTCADPASRSAAPGPVSIAAGCVVDGSIGPSNPPVLRPLIDRSTSGPSAHSPPSPPPRPLPPAPIPARAAPAGLAQSASISHSCARSLRPPDLVGC